jgi:hypothetical protein
MPRVPLRRSDESLEVTPCPVVGPGTEDLVATRQPVTPADVPVAVVRAERVVGVRA